MCNYAVLFVILTNQTLLFAQKLNTQVQPIFALYTKRGHGHADQDGLPENFPSHYSTLS